MGQVLRKYKSARKPGREYSIVLGNDGITYCDCWQWKIHRTCKHLQDYYIANKPIEDVHSPKYSEVQEPINPIQQAINEAVAMMKGNVS